MLKRSMFILVAVFLAAPVFTSVVAYGETGISAEEQNANTSNTAEAEKEVPETVVQKTEREARIKTFKEQHKIRLSVTEKNKIQDKCQAAQGKVSSVTGRFKGIETSRGKVHENLLQRLNNLVEKLKAGNQNTTELEADIAMLVTKIETFNTDLATYKQSVSDLKALDCKTEPESFKAALTAARANLETVRASAKAVHSYLNDTIKPLLKTLRDKVEETTQDGQGGTQ